MSSSPSPDTLQIYVVQVVPHYSRETKKKKEEVIPQHREYASHFADSADLVPDHFLADGCCFPLPENNIRNFVIVLKPTIFMPPLAHPTTIYSNKTHLDLSVI